MPLLIIDPSDMVQKMTQLDAKVAMQTNIAGDEITEQTEQHTFPYVPYREGYLEAGFKSVEKFFSNLLQIDMMYSAKSNQGYDYAAIQHERPFRHRKGTAKYLTKGFREVKVEDIWASRLRVVL